jgi:hypothetical protein
MVNPFLLLSRNAQPARCVRFLVTVVLANETFYVSRLYECIAGRKIFQRVGRQ